MEIVKIYISLTFIFIFSKWAFLFHLIYFTPLSLSTKQNGPHNTPHRNNRLGIDFVIITLPNYDTKPDIIRFRGIILASFSAHSKLTHSIRVTQCSVVEELNLLRRRMCMWCWRKLSEILVSLCFKISRKSETNVHLYK